MKEKLKGFFLGNKKILLISGIVTLLIIAIIGGTYAWFIFNAENQGSITITSGTLSIRYDQGNIIEAPNLKPATEAQVLAGYNDGNCKYNNEEHGEQICYANTFTITNTGTMSTTVTATLINITNGYSDYLKYQVFETAPLTLVGNILGTNSILVGMPSNTLLASSATKTYTLLIWLDAEATNDDQNKNYMATIQVNGVQANSDGTEPSAPVLFKASGVVYDNANAIVPNATVSFHSTPITTQTNENGYYEVEGLEVGEHTIIVTNSNNVQILNDTFTLEVGNEYKVLDKVITAVPTKVKIDIKINQSAKINEISVDEGDISLESVVKLGGTNNEYINGINNSYDSNGNIDGYIIIGYTNSFDLGFEKTNESTSYYAAYIAKYNNAGEQVWIKGFNGNLDERFSHIIESYDENNNIDGYIIVGSSASTNLGYEKPGLKDVLFIKYNLDGTQQWIKPYGGNYGDGFTSIVKSYDDSGTWDGYIMVGGSGSTNLGFTNNGRSSSYDDAIIVKFNKLFEQQWIQNFGGSVGDFYSRVILSYDSNDKVDGYIVTGTYSSTDIGVLPAFSADYSDGMIAKYDLQGNRVWVRRYGGTLWDSLSGLTYSYDDNGNKDGYVVLLNSTSTNAGYTHTAVGYYGNEHNAVLLKYDSEGYLQWAKNLGGNSATQAGYIKATFDVNGKANGYMIFGMSNATDLGLTIPKSAQGYNDIVVFKTDLGGTVKWVKNIPTYGTELFAGVLPLYKNNKEDGYIIIGTTEYALPTEGDTRFVPVGGIDAIMLRIK